jgi:kynureninase
MNFETGPEFAQELDNSDPLRTFRDKFYLPEDRGGLGCVYLCGNSLGLQPKLAKQFVQQELTDWANLGVAGHVRAKRPWMPYHRLATTGLASLTGARENEVVAMNTLTVNLHLMMTTFYRPNAERYKIVIESTAFPSDRFAVMSQLTLHGYNPQTDLLEWRPRDGETDLRLEDLQQMLDRHGPSIALLLLPGVQYYNGQLMDMAALCRMAGDAGCMIGLDLAHAIGNVPLKLHDWAPDFAAWCTYKYLNSGPGAIGGAFVHSRHLDKQEAGTLLGWWGHEESTRFRMAATFSPAHGADLWQLSNPPILSLAPVLASLQIFEEAGLKNLRDKSIQLTGYLDFLLRKLFAKQVASITPATARGCQLSLTVIDPECNAREVFEKLERQNVVADWRDPNVIRVAPVPLYNNYQDIFEFMQRLRMALA